MDVTALDYIYYHVGLTFVCRTIVLLPDAKELPDASTLGIGLHSLTLAEQDCHFRMNDDHPSARVQG